MRHATTAAPKPLSMFTTDTPSAHEFNIASAAATPPAPTPYPTEVGTATTGTATSPATTLGSAPPMPAAEQKEAFREILQDTLAEECSLEVVQSVHEQLCEQIAEQKHDKEAPPVKVTAPQIRQALEVCGVPEEKVAAFEERYQEQLGGGMDVRAVNVVDPRQFEVRTPNVVIKVDPDHSDLVETRVINGSKYILIRADEGVEVNGVNVSILPM